MLRTPPDPLGGYADRWQEKNGDPEVPVRMRGGAVQIEGTRAITKTVEARAEPKGDSHNPFVHDNSIATSSACASLKWIYSNCSESRYCLNL